MLSEEVKRYRELSGDTNPHTPISRIGGYLDGYERALEKEPTATLGKIRAEIAEYGSIWVAYGITDKTKTDKGIEELVTDVLSAAKRQVLGIIDKYKAESEG